MRHNNVARAHPADHARALDPDAAPWDVREVKVSGSAAPLSVSRAAEIWPESLWRERQRAHLARVRCWTDPYRERAGRGERHPVYDFLWEYYSLRPSLLERWHPGLGVVLAGSGAREFLDQAGYIAGEHGVMVAPDALPPARVEAVRWIRDLLHACETRAPFFGCFGLHEWAMVYRTEQIRHETTPLRLAREELARVVEALPVRCSHFDAFRFFTPTARPLNRLQPTSDTRHELEQRGCIHVTMDLYKWAYKLAPFTSAELRADCFELTLAARELDMRASPYDLRGLGFEPVRIETAEGRAEYEHAQRALADRAEPLRGRLIAVCDRALTV